jgi:RNA polymerase sigma-70 factor (sigma-E family)
VTKAEDFEAFVAARQRALWRSAFLLTGESGLAEDLVQTALIRTWPHWGRLAGSEGAEAYVRRAMFTAHASWWRRRWRGETPVDVVPEPARPSTPADPDVRESMRRALLTLPPRQRAAVVLRYFEDLTEVQTAHVLGCSTGTVKSQTFKALETLRRHPGLSELTAEGVSR